MKRLSFIFCLSILLMTACKDDNKINRSLDTHADWMTSLIESKGTEINLRNISMPRAHDAGMYVLNDCSIGGNACNTQTQDLDMTTMLEAGIRVFDVRPMLDNNGEYYTQHVTECDGLGCKGDLISNIFEQTKTFLDSHSELVILELGHWCGTGHEDAAFMAMVEEKLGDRILKSSGSISNFVNEPIGDYVDIYEGKGTVILLFSGADNDAGLRANGIHSYSFIPEEGSYSNTYDFDFLYADQLSKLEAFDESTDAIYKLSWTMTLDATASITCFVDPGTDGSIENYAYEAHGHLNSTIDTWIENGTIYKGKVPNIVSVDYADEFATDVCIRLNELNLN